MSTPVAIQGLPELRKALRGFDSLVRKSFRDEGFRKAAQLVADRSRPLAPHKTGALRASIRGTTSGFKAIVRSPLPYANLQHWGGTTGRGHSASHPGATRVRGTLFVVKAFDANRAQVASILETGIYRVAAQQGWEVKR